MLLRGRVSKKEQKLIDKIEHSGEWLHGKVRVQLLDPDTEKVKYEDGGDNFIAIPAINTMKWWPRYLATMYGYNYSNNSAGFDPRSMPNQYLSHIACWNDTAVEDSATEIGIQKTVTAWGSRWPVSVASNTSRGSINTAVSTVTSTAATFVWDWTPSQGNGTFQSVGWTRMNATTGLPTCSYGRDFTTSNVLDFTVVSTSTSTSWISKAIYWDGTNFNIIDNDGAKFILKNYTTSGGAANATVFNIPTTAGAFSGASTALCGITKISTDWFMCGRNSSNLPCIQKLNSSGTSQWVRSESSGTPATNHYYQDITTDGGTNMWVACSDGKIYRVSVTDGTIQATITVGTPGIGPPTMTTSASIGNGVMGIEYDSSDSNMWVYGAPTSFGPVLWKINPSTGAVVDSPQMGFALGPGSDTATTPYAGTMNVDYGHGTNGFGIAPLYYAANAAPGLQAFQPTSLRQDITSVSTGGSLTLKSTDLWSNLLAFTSSLTTQARGVRLLPHENLGTRKKLGASVVKDSTKALRVTYEFDYTM